MMLVLDTTILIDALHEKSTALRKIIELEESEETICTYLRSNALEQLYKRKHISRRNPARFYEKPRSYLMPSLSSP